MNKKSKKKEVKAEEAYLKQLFHNWDPVVWGMPPHTPMDEYDCDIHNIISHLHAGIDYDGLLDLITKYFKYAPKQEIVQNTKEIWNWWQNK